MGVLKSREVQLVRDLSEVEKSYGVDLKVTKDGDLELSNLGDLKLIAGVDNAAQALFMKLNIEAGGLVYHPRIGTNLQIGEKTQNPLVIQAQILNSLASDPRFENVNVKVTVDGSVYILDIRLQLANTNREVPLRFVVER